MKPKANKEMIFKTNILLAIVLCIYETGEDLWFKAYVLDARYLIPSPLSQTLYLQLINKNTKKPVWQEKYEVNGGFAHGHVYINSELLEGDYFLAACTEHSLLKNQPDFKAIRKIVVKKNLKPRITISTQFKKQSFTSGDSITVTVSCLNEQQKPKYLKIVARLLKGEKELEVQKGQTVNPGGK